MFPLPPPPMFVNAPLVGENCGLHSTSVPPRLPVTSFSNWLSQVVSIYRVARWRNHTSILVGPSRRLSNFSAGKMVGTGRFELPTPRTPSECSTRLSHVPTVRRPTAFSNGRRQTDEKQR